MKKTIKQKQEKPVTVMRTVRLKLVLPTEQYEELSTLVGNLHNGGRVIQEKLYKFSGQKMFGKDGNIVVDGSNATKAQQNIFNNFCQTDSAKGYANPLFGDNFKELEKIQQDLDDKEAELSKLKKVDVAKLDDEKAKEHKKALKKAENQLKYSEDILQLAKARKDKILPIALPKEVKNCLTNYYQYGLINSVAARVQSWYECDKATKDNYTKLCEEFAKATEELHSLYTKEEVQGLLDLANSWSQLDKEYTDTSYLNRKFISYFKNCWQKEQKLTGTWTNADGEEIAYTFDERCHNELLKRTVVWKSDNCILLYDGLADYIDLYNRKEHAKQQSSLTLINYENSTMPIGFDFRGNYPKIDNMVKSSEHTDTTSPTLTISIELPDGQKRNLTAVYKRKNQKHCYLNNLKISPAEMGYTLTFDRSKGVKAVATLTTMFITKLNGQLYLDLPLNIHVEKIGKHGFTKAELNKIRSKFSSAWPEIRDANRTKQNCQLTKEISTVMGKRTLKVAGVDLNYNNPYAYTVYEVKASRGDITYDKITDGVLSAVRDARYNKIENDCYGLMKIIRMTRGYLQGNTDKLPTITQTVRDNYNRLVEPGMPTVEQYYSQVEAWKKDGKLIKDIKSRHIGWVCSNVFFNISKKVRQIRKEHSLTHWDWKTTPDWISALNAYYKLQVTFNASGDGMRQDKDGKRLTKADEHFCWDLLDYIDNLKESYIKKVFGELAYQMYEEGVGIVAVEDLSNFAGNQYQSRHKNRMYNLWPRGQYLKALTDSLEYYNILVQEVNKDGTSQHHAETGNRGNRNGDDLIVMVDGKKTVYHADINASNMVALRMLTFNTNVYKRNLVKVEDDLAVNAYELASGEASTKRWRGVETRANGYSGTVYRLVAGAWQVDRKLKAPVVLSNKKVTTNKENTITVYNLEGNSPSYYEWNKVEEYVEKLAA